MLAGVVMVRGIVVLALIAGILATAFAQEMRRYAFLRTWNIVAKVPSFQTIGASVIAEVAGYCAARLSCRRHRPCGEPGDCMYLIASGEVEIEIGPEPLRLGTENFWEIALLTAPPAATVVAAEPCTCCGSTSSNSVN
jgi:voltage-gated potassium channel